MAGDESKAQSGGQGREAQRHVAELNIKGCRSWSEREKTPGQRVDG